MKLLTNKNYMQRFYTLFFCILFSISLSGQSQKQEVSGQVIDKESQQAICGAEVIIKNSDPLISTTTNEFGYFKFDFLPQGRYYVQANVAEYKNQPINKIDVYPGSSKIICIEVASDDYVKRTRGNLKTKIKKLIAVLP